MDVDKVISGCMIDIELDAFERIMIVLCIKNLFIGYFYDLYFDRYLISRGMDRLSRVEYKRKFIRMHIFDDEFKEEYLKFVDWMYYNVVVPGKMNRKILDDLIDMEKYVEVKDGIYGFKK